MSDAEELYTTFAGLYDRLARAPGVERVRRRFARALDPPTGCRVVEFGCGTGANHPALRGRIGPDGQYVGIDLASGVLRVARRREGGPRTAFCRGDATRPPVRAAGVASDSSQAVDHTGPDAVCATFVVGMLTEPAAAVRRWARLVGPGGRIGLLNLRRTTTPVARVLNGPFQLFVRLSSPPSARGRESGRAGGDSPVERLDRRVTAAHDALRSVCEPATLTRETLFGGFGLLSAGTVADPPSE